MASNLASADRELGLNSQEKALYQRHLDNLTGKGGVDRPNGDRSTVLVNTFGIGDKTYVIPSVWNGKILPPDKSLAKAKSEGLDKFPSYNSEQEAQDRYSQMHAFMEKDTKDYLAAREGGATGQLFSPKQSQGNNAATDLGLPQP